MFTQYPKVGQKIVEPTSKAGTVVFSRRTVTGNTTVRVDNGKRQISFMLFQKDAVKVLSS